MLQFGLWSIVFGPFSLDYTIVDLVGNITQRGTWKGRGQSGRRGEWRGRGEGSSKMAAVRGLKFRLLQPLICSPPAAAAAATAEAGHKFNLHFALLFYRVDLTKMAAVLFGLSPTVSVVNSS